MHMRVRATPRRPCEGLDPGGHGWHAPPCGPGDAWLHVSMATQAAMLAWEDTELALTMHGSIVAWQHRLPCWHGKMRDLPDPTWLHAGMTSHAAMLPWEDAGLA